jgi:hypothetical protein
MVALRRQSQRLYLGAHGTVQNQKLVICHTLQRYELFPNIPIFEALNSKKSSFSWGAKSFGESSEGFEFYNDLDEDDV